MSSKAKPGKFDCYANAKVDEEMFILLARDKHAPALVRAWANARELEREDPEKVAEARACADKMEAWRAANRPKRCTRCGDIEPDPHKEEKGPGKIMLADGRAACGTVGVPRCDFQ